MNETKQPVKIKLAQAALVCQDCKLSDEAKLLITNKITSADYLELLLKNNFYPDAIKFLAKALPVREAIWWAYLCSSQTEINTANEDALAALDIAEKWVYQPDEILRRTAEAIAKKLNYKTASSWLATAIFWSNGSITPPDNLPVIAPDYLASYAVAGAIMLAAAFNKTNPIKENYQRYLQQGINIANGGNGDI